MRNFLFRLTLPVLLAFCLIYYRARRLSLHTKRLRLLAEINLEKILATLQAEKP